MVSFMKEPEMRALSQKEIHEVCGSGTSAPAAGEAASWGTVIYNALAKQIRTVLEALWGSLY